METRIRDRLGLVRISTGALVRGDWSDPALLLGQVFDTVLADYLLGALDGFAPYFQDQLFGRLHRHVGTRLYVVGVTPILGHEGTEQEAWLQRMVRLRDACILLAGRRCYREFPQAWVHRQLDASGFRIADAWALPIVYREAFVNRQLDVATRKLVLVRDQALVQGLTGRIEALREEGLALVGKLDGLRCGADYVVVAEPDGVGAG